MFAPALPLTWVDDFKAAIASHTSVPTRALSQAEITSLLALGNAVAGKSWEDVRVRVEPGRAFLAASVQRCIFIGSVELGCFCDTVELQHGVAVPCGLRDTVVANTSIAGSCYVANTTLLSNCLVMEGVVVVGCGVVACTGPTSFSNGMKLPLGLDGHGRESMVFASITVPEAAQAAQHLGPQDAYVEFVAGVATAVKGSKSVLSAGCRLVNCARVTDVLLGPCAQLESCVVERATVLSSGLPGEVSCVDGGAVVRDALLQWGCHVSTMACVEHAVMCEHAHVDRHGKLLGSLLGPLSGVSEGEVSASLVGPLVGFHHQALLIAALWPEGKGNVGYGANVGSNHTSKAPDQEIRPGEGVFFGLGTSIKFPANYQASPYSIIATGVCTLPQKVDFPFALINTPGESITGLSPAINEISPGWVLSDSVYTLWRNQHKFEKRCTSKRHVIATDVFRLDTVELMVDARMRLIKPKGETKLKDSRGEAIWTDREVLGLGKNYMTESSRRKGIAAYTRYIQLFALRCLHERSLVEGVRVDLCAADLPLHPPSALAPPLSDADKDLWRRQAALVALEFKSTADIMGLLAVYREMLVQEAERTRVAKSKDSARGAAIIPDYDAVHPSADRDSVVLWMSSVALGQVGKPKL